MYIETELQPRFCDTDAGGHINSTAITQWLETGRMHLMMRYLPKSTTVMMRHIEIDYDRELTHRVGAMVRTGVDKIGKKSVTLRQEIWQRDICCVRAIAVDCYFDPSTRVAAEIPENLLEIYRSLMFNA